MSDFRAPQRTRNSYRSSKPRAENEVLDFNLSSLGNDNDNAVIPPHRQSQPKDHVFVKICFMRYLPWYMRVVGHAGCAVLSPWRIKVEKSRDRHLEKGFAERYPSAGDMEGAGN
jgi:hypothetical protein